MWVCIFHHWWARERQLLVYTHILREASAGLLVQRRWAIPEPRKVERATSTALTLFLFKPINANEGSPAAQYDYE